jgi:hypothetical protein
MKFIDTFIRLVGIASLVLLLSGYSKSKDWEYIDWMAIGILIWHEYEIRNTKYGEKQNPTLIKNRFNTN